MAPPEGASAAAIACQGLELSKYGFSWGLSSGVAKGRRLIFYESFFLEGTEYFRYDCVYIYKEGEPEPYIGKIMKIWEDQIDNTNKIKVLWFFRPVEIPMWLELDSNPAYKEIFLASGQGKGVLNINALNVIVGKCRVLCTSLDKRNPQPSEQDLEGADYFFYRAFDVGKYEISEDLSDDVKKFGVAAIFNKRDSLNLKSSASSCVNQQTNGTDIVQSKCIISNGKPALEAQREATVLQTPKKGAIKDEIENAELPSEKETLMAENGVRDNTRTKEVAFNEKETPKEESIKEDKKSSKKRKLSLDTHDNPDIAIGFRMEMSDDVAKKEDLDKVVLESENTPTKKAKLCDNASSVPERLACLVPQATDVKKEKYTAHEIIQVTNRPVIGRDNARVEEVEIEEKQSPKDDSGKDEKDSKNPKLLTGLNEDQAVVNGLRKEVLEDALKRRSDCKKEVLIFENIPVKKNKLIDNSSRASEGLTCPVSEAKSVKKEIFPGRKLIKVTKRPGVESNKWFRELPWDERLQRGYDQGSVILLENFDPSYTSTEVEDIMWNVCAERCFARVTLRTAISSPNMGQALVTFKSKDGAEMAVKKLEEDCLMLSNGRPLIARKMNPVQTGKSARFAGHISVEKHKLLMQRAYQTEDMKNSVATSHCSQPNTIEYRMAMEWCLLQEKSDRWWSELYKQQAEEIKEVKRKQLISSSKKQLDD